MSAFRLSSKESLHISQYMRFWFYRIGEQPGLRRVCAKAQSSQNIILLRTQNMNVEGDPIQMLYTYYSIITG